MSSRFCMALLILACLAVAGLCQDDPLESFVTNDTQGTVFRREGKGFRLNPPDKGPTSGPMRAKNHWQIEFPLALSGDFEVIVSFEVDGLGPKEGPAPFKSNAEVLLKAEGIGGHYGINVACDPQAGKEGPTCFKVARVEPFNNGLHYHILSFPRKSNKGRMGFRREGSALIYLAADGADAELKELIRFPYDSRLEPKLNLAAFQGSGSSLMPVNVLFSQIDYKAEKILKGADSRRPRLSRAIPSTWPTVLDYDGSPGRFLNDTNLTNDKGQVFKVEGKGIRVQPFISPTHQRGVNAYWYRDFKYQVPGDFELSARFDVKSMGPAATEGYGAIAVCLSMQTEGPLGSVNFGRGFARGSGQGYTLTRNCPSANGRMYETLRLPTQADQGRLILRRIGERLDFLIDEGNNDEPVLFYSTFAIVDPAMKLRVFADQGGSNSGPIDVHLTQLSLKAKTLLENGSKVEPVRLASQFVTNPGPNPGSNTVPRWLADPAGDQAEAQAPSRFWLYAILGGGAIGGLSGCIFLVLRQYQNQ